jgi:solute carrier family 30 (zinc transporter), member 1
MLSDVLALLVALAAIRLGRRARDDVFTFGWQRAETLAALVNGVFLLALCLSIALEAIGRFVQRPGASALSRAEDAAERAQM